MITSIVLTGMYKIGINQNNKIKLNTGTAEEPKETLIIANKEIPFIRYRFDKYDDAEIQFIKDNMQSFNTATHLIEMDINLDIQTIVSKISDINIAKFVYIPITDTEASTQTLSAEVVQKIDNIKDLDIDKYMLKDNSTTLTAITADKIIKSIKAILDSNKDNSNKIDRNKLGICSSPLSFNEDCCLSAVMARQLMSKYSITSDVALPSANHQCMQRCGCIRYVVVSSDIPAPADSVTIKKKNSEKKSDTPSAKSESKPKKNIVSFNAYSL